MGYFNCCSPQQGIMQEFNFSKDISVNLYEEGWHVTGNLQRLQTLTDELTHTFNTT